MSPAWAGGVLAGWLALGPAALAGSEVRVVAERDTLAPGLPERVWVAATVDGQPATRAPTVEASGGSARLLGADSAPGVWALRVVPDPHAGRVELTVRVGEAAHRSVLDVGWPTAGALNLPERVDGLAQGEPVRVLLSGPDLPSPEQLQVVVGEGTVLALEPVDGGLELVIQPGDSPFPRMIPVGVRDLRTADRPVWGAIRLRARPRLPLTLEPGASVRLEVGGRTYGPVTADASGQVVMRIDQYPGEAAAEAVLTDDLGNRSTFAVPLTAPGDASLVALAGERGAEAGRPRLVYLRAAGPHGAPWRGPAPTCRSSAAGVLEVLPVGAGVFAVPLEGRLPADLLDVRLECGLGEGVATTVRAGAPVGVPSRLLLQVWPEALSTDLPVAEIRVALEDAWGQRLPVEQVQVRARHGEVRMGQAGQGEYQGAGAVAVGEDLLSARWEPAASAGPVARLGLAWEPLPTAGTVEVAARALDAMGRPVADAAIRLDVEAGPAEVRTGADGWGRASLPVPVGEGPLVIEARSGAALTRRPSPRGGAAPSEGSALGASRVLTLSSGRVAGISVDVDPPILRLGRGAVALITVALEDRAGQPLPDAAVALEASEGELGPLETRPDGRRVATFRPADGERAREVVVTARTDTLRSTARLSLEPRPGRVTIGPSVGWVTNFGKLSSPVLGVDAELRTRLLAESVALRLGFAGYGVVGRAPTGLGPDAEVRAGVFPVFMGAVLRRDRRGLGAWGGAGGLAGVQTVRTRFGATQVGRGAHALAGAGVLGGASYRAGLGDLVLEARYYWVPAPRADLGFSGNLGGLMVGGGFRLVY